MSRPSISKNPVVRQVQLEEFNAAFKPANPLDLVFSDD